MTSDGNLGLRIFKPVIKNPASINNVVQDFLDGITAARVVGQLKLGSKEIWRKAIVLVKAPDAA